MYTSVNVARGSYDFNRSHAGSGSFKAPTPTLPLPDSLIPVPFPLLPDTSLSCFAPKPKLVSYPHRIFERAYHRRVAEINLLGEIDLLAQIIDAWQ